MKKLILALCVISSIWGTSCSEDKCKDVTCQNGGSCVDGSCVCQAGYEGDRCATLSRDKFIGTWIGTMTVKVKVGPLDSTMTMPDTMIFTAGTAPKLKLDGYDGELTPVVNKITANIINTGPGYTMTTTGAILTVNGNQLTAPAAPFTGKFGELTVTGTSSGSWTKK